MRVMLIAAILLATTAEVANGLRNLAQMHAIANTIELRRVVGLDVPGDLPADPWGTPYRIETGRVVSAGSDRKFEDAPAEGQFAGTEGDVVFVEGRPVRSNRNWLYARVAPATDSAAALEELRTAELGAMVMRTPAMRDLTLAKTTAAAMLREDTKNDAWGTPLRVDGARTISAGADKRFDPMSWSRPPATDLGEDIIVENGQVTRAVDPIAYMRANPPAVEVIPQPVDAGFPEGGRHRRVGGEVVAPRVVNRVEPVYSEAYRILRIHGVVVLESTISDKGVVEDVRLLKSVAPDLDSAAMDAVRKWTFEPATIDGRPVPVLFNLTINFKLQ
jgi:TonB family protein